MVTLRDEFLNQFTQNTYARVNLKREWTQIVLEVIFSVVKQITIINHCSVTRLRQINHILSRTYHFIPFKNSYQVKMMRLVTSKVVSVWVKSITYTSANKKKHVLKC